MNKKKAGVFNNIVNCDWPLIWSKIEQMKFYKTDCDDGQGTLGVCCSVDGDMYLSLRDHPRMDTPRNPSFRARTFQGGGRQDRTRIALMLLAIAIQEDEEIDFYADYTDTYDD